MCGLKTASRANPAPAQARVPRVPATRCIASGKPHRYGKTVSSGSVVANDPVNKKDPTGTDTFDEKKYKGKELEVVRALNKVISAKGPVSVTITGKSGRTTSTVTISRNKDSVKITSVTTAKVFGISISSKSSFSGTFSNNKGHEGFFLTNVSVSGDLAKAGQPGSFNIYGGMVNKKPAPIMSTDRTLKTSIYGQSIKIIAGRPIPLVENDDDDE